MHLVMLVGAIELLHSILKEAPPHLMSSWYHHTILYHRLVVMAQWQRLSPLMMMMKNLFIKFIQNPNGVFKFAICSMFVQCWRPYQYLHMAKAWNFLHPKVLEIVLSLDVSFSNVIEKPGSFTHIIVTFGMMEKVS